MPYLAHKLCCLDPVVPVAAISDEANCSWLHQSHHCSCDTGFYALLKPRHNVHIIIFVLFDKCQTLCISIQNCMQPVGSLQKAPDMSGDHVYHVHSRHVWFFFHFNNKISWSVIFIRSYSSIVIHLLLSDTLRDHWTISPLCTGKFIVISQPLTMYKVQPCSRTMIQIIYQQQT